MSKMQWQTVDDVKLTISSLFLFENSLHTASYDDVMMAAVSQTQARLFTVGYS